MKIKTSFVGIAIILILIIFSGCVKEKEKIQTKSNYTSFSIDIIPTLHLLTENNTNISYQIDVYKNDKYLIESFQGKKYIDTTLPNTTLLTFSSLNHSIQNISDYITIKSEIINNDHNTSINKTTSISNNDLQTTNTTYYSTAIQIYLDPTQEQDITDYVEVRLFSTISVYRAQTPHLLQNQTVTVEINLSSSLIQEQYITDGNGLISIENFSISIKKSETIKLKTIHQSSGYFVTLTYTPNDSDKTSNNWYRWETTIDLYSN